MEKPSKREANVSLQFPIIRRGAPGVPRVFYMENTKFLSYNLRKQYTLNQT